MRSSHRQGGFPPGCCPHAPVPAKQSEKAGNSAPRSHGVAETRREPPRHEFYKLLARADLPRWLIRTTCGSAMRIGSEMTLRILKSSILVLDALNDVRNNQSLVRDNDILSCEEALLILNHLEALIRFLKSLEEKA